MNVVEQYAALSAPLAAASKPRVAIVDEEQPIRASLAALMHNANWDVQTFASGRSFLKQIQCFEPNCLLLSSTLPDMSGFEIQAALDLSTRPTIIFMSRHANIDSSVRAIKLGALDFLIKPIDEARLLRLAEAGLAQNLRHRTKQEALDRLRNRFDSLTPRERDVLSLLTEGLRNKQAAVRLGISETTLQIHRSRIMRKTQAISLAGLLRMVFSLEIHDGLPDQCATRPR